MGGGGNVTLLASSFLFSTPVVLADVAGEYILRELKLGADVDILDFRLLFCFFKSD